jgi:sugar phosphate isomerase/epimerase
VIRLGNASAPRWYREELGNLDAYIERLVEFGATSTELILHHGPSDERNSRVAIQEHDWQPIVDRFLRRGLHCDFHASLAPAFSLRRWQREPRRLQSQYSRLLRFGEHVSDLSGAPVVLVIHAANAREHLPEVNARATANFLAWAVEESNALGGGMRFALELRHDPDAIATRFDVDRSMLRRLVAQFESDRVGICWDVGNDLQQATWVHATPEPPDSGFLAQVIHVHAHGQRPGGNMHYPILSPDEPVARWLGLLPGEGYSGSVTMEIRYRHAATIGDPLEILGRTYQIVRGRLETTIAQP